MFAYNVILLSYYSSNYLSLINFIFRRERRKSDSFNQNFSPVELPWHSFHFSAARPVFFRDGKDETSWLRDQFSLRATPGRAAHLIAVSGRPNFVTMQLSPASARPRANETQTNRGRIEKMEMGEAGRFTATGLQQSEYWGSAI